MFAEIAASRRPIMPSIEIKPLSYLDPRIFAPQVDVSGVVEGNLAATKSVMAGIQSGVSSVAGGIKEKMAMDAAGKQQTFQNELANKKLAQGDRALTIQENRPLRSVFNGTFSPAQEAGFVQSDEKNDWAPGTTKSKVQQSMGYGGQPQAAPQKASGFGIFSNPQ